MLENQDLGLPCVHCGLCLNTCPTYRLFGNEGDSPRGRLYIMEAVNQRRLELDAESAEHLDRCLGCLACETACPSGVSFGRRIEAFRPRLPQSRFRKLRRKLTRDAAVNGRLLGLGRGLARAMDTLGLERLRRKVPGLGLLPADTQSADASPLERSRVAAPAQPRMRVALLTGCGGDRMAPSINTAAVEVLHRNGIEVVEVPRQGCCGALDLHGGNPETAKRLAAANVRAFAAANIDCVVTTAAGCGAMLRGYDHLLDGERAAAWTASSAKDICELLAEVGIEPPRVRPGRGLSVAYHDACHLLHGCGVSAGPRAVLEAATGRAAVDLGENELCCGSAGSYNVDRHRTGRALGERKAELAAAGGFNTIAVGNVGCMMQMTRAVREKGMPVRVAHPVELLAEAYRAGS